MPGLPTRMEVCWRCEGHGTHMNPNIDGNGLDPHDPDLDDEFWEMYHNGGYDVRCQECKGVRVLEVPDEPRMSAEQLAELREEQEWRREAEAERQSEMQWGY